MTYTSVEQLVTTLKSQLANSDERALKALVTIYKNQTRAEQATQGVINHNGIGFRPCDAQFMSSLASLVLKGFKLSEKQMYHVRKCMPVYARQLVNQSIREGKIKKDGNKYVW